MPRGSFEDEWREPTRFTAWLLVPGSVLPIPYDTLDEALEVVKLETWYAARRYVTMADLHQGARPDERFHLQSPEPVPVSFGWRWLWRRTWWQAIYNPDGSPGKFCSWVMFWGLQWYSGTTKCDGTRTFMYRSGQLGEPFDPTGVVMTTTPKELLAFRWKWGGYEPTPVWTNMGGS